MEENNDISEGNGGMADKDRLDLDAMNSELMKDVREAGKIVNQRKQKEKVAEAKAKDKTLMYTIVVFATLVIFALAYWKTFMTGTPQNQNTQERVHSMPAPVQQQPQQQQPAQPYRPAPQYNTAPRTPASTYHPPRVVTPSQPSQSEGQVPSETIDEGQDGGM